MKSIVYIGKFLGIIGGIERYMQHSAILLRRNGFTVHYLYTGETTRNAEEFTAAFDSVQKFSVANEYLQTADMIVVHNMIPPGFLKLLPESKTFFFAHDHNIYCRRHHYYTPLGRKNCHRQYHALRCLLCSLGRNEAPPLAEYRKLPALVLSDFMAENLRKNGFKNVFKLPAFIQIKESQQTFMPDGVLRILFLGQLIRGKGADLMIPALANLPIPFECTIAGEGKDREMLENMVTKYNLSNKVKFTGFVNDPETLWQNCDVFCFPIRWQEPFGLVGLEAMAHGIPVVAFDHGGVREWLDDPRNGFAIPEYGDLETAFTTLAGNLKMLQMMGECGKKIAEEKFSEHSFIEKFSLLLQEESK